jgi:hypothetical protein
MQGKFHPCDKLELNAASSGNVAKRIVNLAVIIGGRTEF